MTVVRERDIVAYFQRRVKDHDAFARKVRWEGRNDAPDWLLIHGYAMSVRWLEFKAPGGKPTPGQLIEHDLLRKYGQTVLIVDSFEAVDALFG